MMLTLRPWAASDAPAVLAAFGASDLGSQSAGPIRTRTDAVLWIERLRLLDARRAVAFAVDEDGTAVGSVMVSAIERRHDTGWVSYWTAPLARGRGIATVAAAALAAHAFDQLGLFRLELGHRLNNPASCGVALGAGFAAEGIERAKLRYGERRYDVETHARLAGDPAPRLAGCCVVRS